MPYLIIIPKKKSNRGKLYTNERQDYRKKNGLHYFCIASSWLSSYSHFILLKEKQAWLIRPTYKKEEKIQQIASQ